MGGCKWAALSSVPQFPSVTRCARHPAGSWGTPRRGQGGPGCLGPHPQDTLPPLGQGLPPGCAELAWDYANSLLGLSPSCWGHRGWHRGDNLGSLRGAPGGVGAAGGVPCGLRGWGGGGRGVTRPQGAPLTLLIHLLQPLSHQDGEWPPGGGGPGGGGCRVPRGTAPVSPGSAGHGHGAAGSVASCAHPPRDPTGTRGRFVLELAAPAAGTAPRPRGGGSEPGTRSPPAP